MARSAEGHEGRHVPLSDHEQRQTDRREHFGRGVRLSKMHDIEHKSVAYSSMHIGMVALLLRTRIAPGYTSLSTHRCIARILWSLVHCLWYASLWSRYGCIATVCIAMWYVTFTHALATYTHIHAMHTRTRTHTHTHKDTHTYTQRHTHIHTRTHTHVRANMCAWVMNIYIYIYIYILNILYYIYLLYTYSVL